MRLFCSWHWGTVTQQQKERVWWRFCSLLCFWSLVLEFDKARFSNQFILLSIKSVMKTCYILFCKNHITHCSRGYSLPKKKFSLNIPPDSASFHCSHLSTQSFITKCLPIVLNPMQVLDISAMSYKCCGCCF